jgi:hypothetical protein
MGAVIAAEPDIIVKGIPPHKRDIEREMNAGRMIWL